MVVDRRSEFLHEEIEQRLGLVARRLLDELGDAVDAVRDLLADAKFGKFLKRLSFMGNQKQSSLSTVFNQAS